MGKERCYHRFPVPGARLRGAAFDAPVLNLSKTGLAIRSERELQPGDFYSAWLETDTDRSWIAGRVVRCAPLAGRPNHGADAFEVGLSVQTIEKERPAEPLGADPEPEPLGPTGGRVPGLRKAPRVEVSGMRLRTSDLDAQVVNLSRRGLAIRADRALDTGQAHDARLETRDGALSLKALVVWCERDPGSGEGAAASYAAGLSLSDVDQRLSPLADALAPMQEEAEQVEWPGPVATNQPQADESARGEELAPWMAAVTESTENSSARRDSARRLIMAAGILAGVGALSALWVSARRLPEPAAAQAEESGSLAARQPVKAVVEATETESKEIDDAGDSTAPPTVWQATVPEIEAADAAEPEFAPALGSLLVKPGANVRSGPGLEHRIVRRTGENERLPFVSKQGEWFRLRAAEESWMHEVTVRAVQEVTAPVDGSPRLPTARQ